MKKIALALVASTIAAGSASANIGTGFYVGGAVGYGATNYKSSNQTNFPDLTLQNGSSAASIGINAGYGWVNACLYFGGEVGYTFENNKTTGYKDTTTGQSVNMELKRNGYASVAALLGWLPTTNTLLYVRLGGNWGKWQAQNFINSVLFHKGSSNRLSFAPGLGVKTAIHKNVYVFLEWTYEMAPSITAKRVSGGAADDVLKVNSVRTQTGKVGFSYKF